MKIEGKNILVTGASSGIGNRAANYLSSKGASVIALDKDIDGLKLLKKKNKSVCFFQCNLEESASIDSVFKKLVSSNTNIDILINCAAIMFNSPIVKLQDGQLISHKYEDWQKVIGINLTGTFYVTSHVVKNMLSFRKKGLIINLSSICAQGNPGQAAYSASKAGVEGFSRALSKELGPLGIRTVILSPGFIDSPGMHQAISEKSVKKWRDLNPLRRLGAIDEVLEGIKMIISNDYINGSTIEINGGLTI